VEFCKAKLLSYPAQPDSSHPIYGENSRFALVKTGKNEKKQKRRFLMMGYSFHPFLDCE
jgi:hypothetical protein